MDLREVVDEIATGIEFDLGRSLDHPVDKIGDICDAASSGSRTLAGCALLLDADTDRYYHLLARSAEVRRYFLDRCRQEAPGLRNEYRAAGNSGPLLDAIAARHFTLAQAVAKLSNTDWWEGEEYPEDFYYARFLQLVVQDLATDGPEVREAVIGLEGALAGSEAARLAVCQSLSVRDQGAFDGAFEALLERRGAELNERGEPFTPYDEASDRVDRTFYIEGLALLNVADRIGLSTLDEYRFCPATARIPMRAPFPDDSLMR